VDAVKIGFRDRTAGGRVATFSFSDSDVKTAKFDMKRRITMIPNEIGTNLLMRLLEGKTYKISNYN
jgi:hypothetical protein